MLFRRPSRRLRDLSRGRRFSCRRPLESSHRERYRRVMKHLQLAACLFLAIATSSCLSTGGSELSFGPETGTIGYSVEGRAIRVERFGKSGPTVLFIATIHGNEAAGTPLLREFSERLTNTPEHFAERRVVLVPEANPDGVLRGARHNASGVDLNRNFPAGNRAERATSGRRALSEPESRALSDLIRESDPDLVVSIHQPVGCVDYDGPAEAIATRMSEACGLPVRRLGARPGSLGSWVGVDRQVPIITLELPRNASELSEEELWNQYGSALFVALESPLPVEPVPDAPKVR